MNNDTKHIILEGASFVNAIFLYEFILSTPSYNRSFYFTNYSGNWQVKYLNNVYVPILISHSKANQQDDGTSITVMRSTKAIEFMDTVLNEFDGTITLKMYYANITEANTFDESSIKTYFVGQCTSKSFAPPNLVIQFKNPLNLPTMTLGWRQLSRVCPYRLYGNQCKASVVSHTVKATVLDVDYNKGCITVGNFKNFTTGASTSITPSKFTEGDISFTNGTGASIIYCTSANGKVIAYLSKTSSLIQPGMVGNMRMGCDKSVECCKYRFGNLTNYGGFPFVPTSNPNNATSL